MREREEAIREILASPPDTATGRMQPLDEVFDELRQESATEKSEQAKTDSWPVEFFDDIRIDDPAFQRPSQGDVPTSPH